jgi:hypothetical protein
MRRRDALPDPDVAHDLRELDAALAGEPTADPDLTALVAGVAAVRPEPDAAFLADLDARVRAGFPRQETAGTRRPAAKSWRARILRPQVLAPGFAVVLLAGVVTIALQANRDTTVNDSGTFASSPSSSPGSAETLSATAPKSAAGRSDDAVPAPSQRSAAGQADQAAAGAVPSTSSLATPSAAPSSDTAAPRKVERTVELTLVPAPEDVQDTADGVVRETQAAGGYVQQSDISISDRHGIASFTLRIPSARLDTTLARLSKLAHVGALNQSASDITAQTVSAADQLSDARDQRRALLRALGRATTDRQIASLKARLRDNRSEIARRKGALDAQRRRADLATVAVTVQGTAKTHHQDGGGAWTPRDALHDAGRVLQVIGGVALIALAVLMPLGILGVLALLGMRTVRGRRRETALDRAA